jgi:hypothetical protein
VKEGHDAEDVNVGGAKTPPNVGAVVVVEEYTAAVFKLAALVVGVLLR